MPPLEALCGRRATKYDMKKVVFYLRLILGYLEFWGYPPESCYSRIAAIHYEYENYRKAISLWLKSEASHHGSDRALAKYNCYFLGYSYWKIGSLREANRYFEKYFQLEKKNLEIASMIAFYYEVIYENEAALAWYLHTLALEPRLLAPRVECVRLLSELERIEEALKFADEAVEIATTPVTKQIAKSIRLKVDGYAAQSIAILKDAIAQPDSAWRSQQQQLRKDDAYLLLARFQKDAGDAKGALETLQSAAREQPIDPWLSNELAMEYVDQGIFLENGLCLIERALKSQPENAIFLDTKSHVLLKLGRSEEAKAALEKSRELLPEYHNATGHASNLSGAVQ